MRLSGLPVCSTLGKNRLAIRVLKGKEMPRRRSWISCLTMLGVLAGSNVAAAQLATIADLQRAFERPPDDARIMMRWWWFGAAVSKPELERELRAMKEGGIGGVEVQPVYPLALDDPERGFRNLAYLSDDFIDALRFAAQKARELGLRIDITLGSGWPYGGPHVPITEGAGRLRCDRVPVPENAGSLPLPSLEHGEKLIAVFLAPGDGRSFSSQGIRQLTGIESGRLQLPRGLSGSHVVLFFISSRTGQQVKRAAVGAEGFVLDHYDRTAIEHHLKVAGDRLLQAFGPNPPYAVFSDSLEVYGSDWTSDLPEEFRKRRGYDLIPFLPALVGDIGEKTSDIRHDWGQTLTELAEERYLTPIRAWAQRHGTRFRSQTYGIPPVMLSSNALVDLPEGEGSEWRSFSRSRWAASASHLYGRPVTSSETWTWLHSPSFRATPLDMKAEADLHFLQGITQLIGHGWPYSPPSASEPGWRFYAAAVFNDHNPWWMVMPDITRYLQRVSFVLRQGKPANDLALYLPTDDAWAGFTAGKDSINQAMGALLGPTLIPQILDAGYNFDFIDDRAIQHAGIPYSVLMLPTVKQMPPATARKLEEYKHQGGIVVQAADIGELPRLYPPDFATGNPAVGFIHRKLPYADVYFVANTGNQPVRCKASVRLKDRNAEWWDPFTGSASLAGGSILELDLQPYESRVLVFSERAGGAARPSREIGDVLNLSSDWTLTFAGSPKTVRMDTLSSWSDDESMKFFSGTAVYEKVVRVPESLLKPGLALMLNFGVGTPIYQTATRTPGMRAWIESPVREAAVVEINGQAASPVWRPPYEVEITRLLHAGENKIRVVVGNLAINQLAGQAMPSYRLLNLRYGERFTPQDMDHLQPLPSGLLGPIHLKAVER